MSLVRQFGATFSTSMLEKKTKHIAHDLVCLFFGGHFLFDKKQRVVFCIYAYFGGSMCHKDWHLASLLKAWVPKVSISIFGFGGPLIPAFHHRLQKSHGFWWHGAPGPPLEVDPTSKKVFAPGRSRSKS